jgi:hypothetical protein
MYSRWVADRVVQTRLLVPSQDPSKQFLADTRFGLEVPHIYLDYGRPRYNESKVALLVEDRPDGKIAPILLHMMSILPADWRFHFMGSDKSTAFIKRSAAIRRKVADGKLDITKIPKNITINGGEQISRFFTNPQVYKELLYPAEWLLVFQTDSIICANSLDNIDEFLHYDWIGAPWVQESRYHGNGGLSLRRVSSILKVLSHQNRYDGAQPEDLWLAERLGHLPGAHVANKQEAMRFSAESLWVDYPMGFHLGNNGQFVNSGVFGTQAKREHIYDYCPEIKMVMDMDLEMFIPGECNNEW